VQNLMHFIMHSVRQLQTNVCCYCSATTNVSSSPHTRIRLQKLL